MSDALVLLVQVIIGAVGVVAAVLLARRVPYRGKRRTPPDSPPESVSTLGCSTPNLSPAEAAAFEAFVHANPVLSSRLTQLWAGIEPDKEQAS